MKINTAIYRTTMPDGSLWDIPVIIIARNRAENYAHEFGGDVDRSLLEDTAPLFESDDFEIEDWAQNNMNWSDVKYHATVFKDAPPTDYGEGWVNGEHSVVSGGE